MKTLNRLLLLALSLALVAAVYAMQSNTTQISVGHETLYHMRWPWLHEVREVSIFAILIWSFIFVKREAAFVRIGLAALIIAFTLQNLPAKIGSVSDLVNSVWQQR
jgi:hypothetical protein